LETRINPRGLGKRPSVQITKERKCSQNCSNWRGITLLSVIRNIISGIRCEKIKIGIETKLRREQAGFRSNRSCVDQINRVRILIKQSNEFLSALYLLFIDFEKAFDSIDRDQIWIELKIYGIPPKIKNSCKNHKKIILARLYTMGNLVHVLREAQVSNKGVFAHQPFSLLQWIQQ
jgi:hypothetical protein